jgi:hypothetical protein
VGWRGRINIAEVNSMIVDYRETRLRLIGLLKLCIASFWFS